MQYHALLIYFFTTVCVPLDTSLAAFNHSMQVLLLSYWKHVTGLNATKIMEAVIKMFPSSAVYLASSPANPVAWMIYYHHGHMGHWFTVEEHRRKGLGTLVAEDLCKKL